MGKCGRWLVEFFLFMSKTMLEVGWSFILWSMLYLEGWSYGRIKLFGVALLTSFLAGLMIDRSSSSSLDNSSETI